MRAWILLWRREKFIDKGTFRFELDFAHVDEFEKGENKGDGLFLQRW